ncbi:MAG: hypothetical protein M0Z53_07330 [Thermaerobacter sp.]|nr:hypothetical protein [Thermaerobacter sp.]
MNTRMWLAAGGFGLLVGVAAWVSRPQPAKTPAPTAWKTANPVLSAGAYPLSPGTAARFHTAPIKLPAGQLSAADWYLPLSPSVSVAYELHDILARWQVQGVAQTLAGAPANPALGLSFAPSGRMLAWPAGTGMAVASWPHGAKTLPHAAAVGFTGHNQLVVASQAGGEIILTRPGTSTPPLRVTGQPAQSRPFAAHASLLAIQSGSDLGWVNTVSGHPATAVKVDGARWPDLIAARRAGNASAWLLERPSPLPAYLLIVTTPGRKPAWYRWRAAEGPQLAVAEGRIVFSQSLSSGIWWAVGVRHLHPMALGAGLVSDGPYGLIWRASQGFSRLTGGLSW